MMKLKRGNRDEYMRNGSRMESTLASKRGNLHFHSSIMDTSSILVQKSQPFSKNKVSLYRVTNGSQKVTKLHVSPPTHPFSHVVKPQNWRGSKRLIDVRSTRNPFALGKPTTASKTTQNFKLSPPAKFLHLMRKRQIENKDLHQDFSPPIASLQTKKAVSTKLLSTNFCIRRNVWGGVFY
jgi:hypothetical protein